MFYGCDTCAMYRKDSATKRIAQNHFVNFKNRISKLTNAPRPARLSEVAED